ncbi:class I SAM-dependent methyltransferase [Candidatus Woesearchaeota archaeon]|nr:class I SAM-dependent methyltransferase [Candidatus Woesearchaeota archaeon]
MPFGSFLSRAGVFSMKTSDEIRVTFNKTIFHRIGLRVLGIPHLGHRMRARNIFSIVTPRPPQRPLPSTTLLDAGCGGGLYSLEFARRGFQVTGVDIDEENIKNAAALAEKMALPATFVKASLYALPFKDGTFDQVLCTEVLEHLTEDKKALSEIARVLKPGGIAYFTFPSDAEFNKSFQQLLDHVRVGYSYQESKEMFEKNRLSIEEFKTCMSAFGKKAWTLNRLTFKSKIATALFFYPLYWMALLDELFGIHDQPFNYVFRLKKRQEETLKNKSRKKKRGEAGISDEAPEGVPQR